MDKFDKISNIISNMIKDKVIFGASYGFLQGEISKSFYIGMQGATNPFNSIPIKQNMYYDLASLTKVIGTTTRILEIIESGKLNFSDTVKSILPNFLYPSITIENLLLHNSGLTAGIVNKDAVNEDNIIEAIYKAPLIYKPETKSVYSDIGFIFLGFIIEKLDDMSIEDSFQKYIFKKLNMINTSYNTLKDKSLYVPTECTDKRGCIQGLVHDSKSYILGQNASAGLFSTLDDVILFCKSVLTNDEKILSSKTLYKIKEMNVFNRTYGWDKMYGNNILYHSGFTGTSILLTLNKKEGFILLTNRIHPNRDNENFIEMRDKLNKIFIGD